MISCIIIEDEPNAMRLLQDHIGKTPSLALIGSCYNAMEALELLKKQPVDLLFLDINMPRISGLELAAMLPAGQKIIFTTAYAEYALDSFDYHVVDYLLKPITFKRFMQAVGKLEQSAPPVPVVVEDPSFLFVRSGRQLHKISYDDIRFLEATKEYVAIHTSKEKLLVYKRMKEMEQALPDLFTRIHNSYIVNLAYVNRFDGTFVALDDRELPVSNGYRDAFLEKINKRVL